MEQSKFVVTLADLRKHRACYEGYNRVVRMLQGKEFSEHDLYRETYICYQHKGDISLVDIANNNGIDDAIWALRCVKGIDRDCRLFAVWCARQVQNNMNPESINLLNSSEDYANSKISIEQLEAERAAASDTAWYAASDTARDAASDTAWDAARDAASDTAWDAAWYAASDAASHAAWYAARDAARDAASDTAWDAAWYAAREKQKKMFIAMCNGQAPWQKEQQCITS